MTQRQGVYAQIELELASVSVLGDSCGERVCLSRDELHRIAGWLAGIFDEGVENYPRGAVGAALCSETSLLDSHRELTVPEIDRILDAIWWEGARSASDEGEFE